VGWAVAVAGLVAVLDGGEVSVGSAVAVAVLDGGEVSVALAASVAVGEPLAAVAVADAAGAVGLEPMVAVAVGPPVAALTSKGMKEHFKVAQSAFGAAWACISARPSPRHPVSIITRRRRIIVTSLLNQQPARGRACPAAYQ